MYAERHFYVLSYAHAVPVLITPHGRVARASRVAISHLKAPQRPGARTPRAGRRATAHPVPRWTGPYTLRVGGDPARRAHRGDR